MRNVLIIGKNSYIGQSFQKYVESNNTVSIHLVSASNGDWMYEDFSKYETVLHLSGIVHIKEKDMNADLYEKVNHQLAVDIAKKAKDNHVKQFILMSTAAVYGSNVTRITKDTVPNPTTYYGKSKLAAEQDIMKLKTDNFRIAIVRPPMVYGEGCNGNYIKLQKLAKITPIFPNIHNKRSMIHIDTLCEFLLFLIKNECCGCYHPQDKDYVDTCNLVINMRKQMGKKTLVIGIFNSFIYLLGRRNNSIHKMFGDCFYNNDIADKL